MDLLQLKYFQKVAQLKHLTKAADELHITQPALSQMIAKLERYLDVPLFDREGRQIKLNAYGSAFLAKVNVALEALEEGQREIADMAGLERGAIALDSTFIPHFPQVVQAFLAAHPDVQIHIAQAADQEAKERLLIDGDIDFCMACYPIRHKGIVSMPLQQERILLAVPASSRLADRSRLMLREAADEPFVCFRRGQSFRQTTDELCQLAGFAPKITCEAEAISVVNDLVRAGIGVALLPASLAVPHANIRLLHIESPESLRTYYLSWKEQRYLSAAARAFRDYLVAHVAVTERSPVPPT